MKYHCRPDGTSVVMGIVDDGSIVGKLPRPKEHIFLGEKAQWWNIPNEDSIARHASFNESFQDRMKEWIAKGRQRRSDLEEQYNDLPTMDGCDGTPASSDDSDAR